MSRLHIRSVLLATLTLLFGLHTFRVFLSVVIWYLGQRLNGPQLALYALATFAMALPIPLVRRFLGSMVGRR